MNDSLERRLRASRPPIEDDVDGELLARVRAMPIDSRPRLLPRAAPVVALAAAAAVAIVVLTGGPSGTPSASALTQQALRWFTPAPGTILHVRSVESQGGVTTTRELWESADDPAQSRQQITGATSYETAGSELYDPAANVIYELPDMNAKPSSRAERKPGRVDPLANLPAADPIVDKTRTLLQAGDMQVAGRATIDGQDAWAISLKADAGRPVWTLYVAASDGRPLELTDPGRDASEPAQTIRWPIYEVLHDSSGASALLTLAGAHPGARLVTDRGAAEAAQARLMPPRDR